MTLCCLCHARLVLGLGTSEGREDGLSWGGELSSTSFDFGRAIQSGKDGQDCRVTHSCWPKMATHLTNTFVVLEKTMRQRCITLKKVPLPRARN